MLRSNRRLLLWAACALALLAGTCLPAMAQARDPLLDLLVTKGVIGKTEADHVAASPADQQRSLLTQLLERKGVLTPQDVSRLAPEPATAFAPAPIAPASTVQPTNAAPPPAAQPAPPRRTAQRTLPDRSAAANPRQTATDAPLETEGRDSPLSFRIGGVQFTPGGFVDFDTIFRTTNTGNIGTNFFAIPFSNTVAGHNSEVRLTAQQTRFSLKAQDRLGSNDVTAYVSMDFLGNDAVNTFVTSNSHTVRLFEAWANVRNGSWELLAGQVWGLQTPNRVGLNTMDSTVFTTYNEDPNYQVGMPWTRAAAIRGIFHASPSLAFALEVQNPEQFGGQGETTFPSAFNAQLGGQIDQANLSSTPNLLPDFIGKMAYDTNPGGPGNLHLELGGLVSVFRVAVLPDVTGATFVHHTAVGGGGFAAVNAEVLPGLTIVANGFGGPGTGRYIAGMGPDLVALPANAAGTTCAVSGAFPAPTGCDVTLSNVKSAAGIGGVEYRPWQNTVLAAYYGGAYFQRNFALDITSTAASPPFIGFGGPNSANNNNKSIQEASLDWVQNWWSNQQYGTVQTALQASYVTRAPWFVPAGAPKNAHLAMGFFSLKYLLPP